MFIILFILVAVAFYTLIERKIISIRQIRVGPNKIGFMGFIQPIIDGIKLFIKIHLNIYKINYLFYLSPCLVFIIMLILWYFYFYINLNLKFIFLFVFFGFSSYFFLTSGWRRFSKFGYLGGLRSSSQSLSYEIILIIIFLFIIVYFNNINIKIYNNIFLTIFLFYIMIIWLLLVLTETNRAPFDFSEGERELISGFNIEYSSSGFVLWFLSEYAIIIWFRFFTALIFYINIIFIFLFLYFLVLLRNVYPRFRYDFLIFIFWVKLMPPPFFIINNSNIHLKIIIFILSNIEFLIHIFYSFKIKKIIIKIKKIYKIITGWEFIYWFYQFILLWLIYKYFFGGE